MPQAPSSIHCIAKVKSKSLKINDFVVPSSSLWVSQMKNDIMYQQHCRRRFKEKDTIKLLLHLNKKKTSLESRGKAERCLIESRARRLDKVAHLLLPGSTILIWGLAHVLVDKVMETNGHGRPLLKSRLKTQQLRSKIHEHLKPLYRSTSSHSITELF